MPSGLISQKKSQQLEKSTLKKIWDSAKLIRIFSLNHIFTEIQLESIPDQQSISAEVVRVLIHGHSLYDEAAFYELYMTGAIDSRKSLDNFIGTRIPGFKGLTEKEFDAIMSKWLYHLLSRFWILPLVVKSRRAKLNFHCPLGRPFYILNIPYTV